MILGPPCDNFIESGPHPMSAGIPMRRRSGRASATSDSSGSRFQSRERLQRQSGLRGHLRERQAGRFPCGLERRDRRAKLEIERRGVGEIVRRHHFGDAGLVGQIRAGRLRGGADGIGNRHFHVSHRPYCTSGRTLDAICFRPRRGRSHSPGRGAQRRRPGSGPQDFDPEGVVQSQAVNDPFGVERDWHRDPGFRR
jgi:hypothetical protein